MLQKDRLVAVSVPTNGFVENGVRRIRSTWGIYLSPAPKISKFNSTP